MAKTYIVGNWKMNFTVGEASLYLHKLLSRLPASRSVQVIVAPSTVALQPLSLQVDRRRLKLCAQNICPYDYGAFTGETSVAQLRSIVDYVLVGHSERRLLFGETEKDIRAKVSAALRADLTPIICLGETARERRDGETADVLRDQLLSALRDVSVEDLPKVILAYEPVWAISSTRNSRLAPLDKVSDAISLLRRTLEKTFGAELASAIPILYGGSVSLANASAYLGLDGVNGLLIGGASLINSEFTGIIDLAKEL
ncbi:triose-phosphate isomerase [Candidatus Saccharibacteria bacterium]|nr:triose-phosphate isomerase [Candidatus Saccharibacteria bacterium]